MGKRYLPSPNVQVKAFKAHPGQHGNVKTVLRLAGLGRKAARRRMAGHVLAVARQKRREIPVAQRPDAGKRLFLRGKHRVSGVHFIKIPQSFRRELRAELRKFVHRLRKQPEHGRINLMPAQPRDVQPHGDGIGTHHLLDIVLVILPARPGFQIDFVKRHVFLPSKSIATLSAPDAHLWARFLRVLWIHA